MSGTKGLSILIPVYNYEVLNLVLNLRSQAEKLEIPYEIRCYDDFSDEKYKAKNRSLMKLGNVTYKELPKNLGRSRIRNRLAFEAHYSSLLFIDCDSKINSENYLEKYLVKAFTHDVVFGGTEYATELLNPKHSLRWKYGRKREEIEAKERKLNPYDHITFNNIFVSKELFLGQRLDETIMTYGHEDTKFGYQLKAKNIPVAHINNPVEHIGLEPNRQYLDKTAEGVKNLYKILQEDIGKETRLYKSFSFLRKFALTSVFKFFYSTFRKRIEKNLTSADPRLFYFDLYKLHLIVEEHNKRKAAA